VVLAAVLGFGLLAALHTSGTLIRVAWLPILVWLAAPGVLAWWWGRAQNRHRAGMRRVGPLVALAGVCLLALVSSVALHRWFYFIGWAPDPRNLLASGLVRFALLTVLLVPFYAWGPRRAWVLPLLVLVGSQVWCVTALLERTQGVALYRTDHPSFMFRLWEFTRTFPHLANYLPHWNAGVLHTASLTSGTPAPGLVLFPLFRFFPVHEVYTYAWATLFLGIVPWLGVGAVRAMGGDRTAAFIGGMLALGISQHFFLWALHYGTIGATFASAMTMPMCALSFRVVHQGRMGWGVAAALVLSALLMLVWAPLGAVAVAVVLSTLLAADRWTWRRVGFLVACGGAVAVLYSPWLLTMANEAATSVAFITAPTGQGVAPAEGAPGPLARFVGVLLADGGAPIWRGFELLRAHAREVHPLLLFFGLVPLVLGLNRSLTRWFLPIVAMLTAITGWALEFMPNSQLSRMAIPLCFVCVPPAAFFLGRLVRADDRRLALVRAGVVALLAMGGLSVVTICANRSRAPYATMGTPVPELVAWLRANTSAEGRILFAGPCVHGFGRGNVAYLPLLTEREMMAVDYYGFPPKMVVYEYPPRAFCQTPELLETFFDSYNVSHLITYHENWKQVFRASPDRYRECTNLGAIAIFERPSHPGFFHQNSGRVHADLNRLEVELDDPNAPAVIAYNWVEGLQAPAPVVVRPHVVTNGLSLIEIEPHGVRSFVLTFKRSLLTRKTDPQEIEP
jgi:hypothetical protein